MPITGSVTPIDLAVRLRRSLTDAEHIAAQADIDDTYALLESHGLLQDPVPSWQLATVARIALRAFRNPEGITQESLGSRSVTYADGARPGVYLTPDDVTALRGPTQQRAYSMRLSLPSDY